MTDAPPLVISSKWNSVGGEGRCELANQEAADSGYLFQWERMPGFGCSSSGSNTLKITIVWNGLSADAGNGHWWKQLELHQTGYQPSGTQTIDAHQYGIPFLSWKTWWQFNSAWVYANRSTGGRSADESTSSSDSWATSTAIIEPIADFFLTNGKSDWRCWRKEFRSSCATKIKLFS